MNDKDFLWLHLKDLPYFRAMLRAVEAAFYQDFTLEEPVLDLGCGDGHFASLTFDHQLDVGLDPWIGPIRHAQKTQTYRGLVQADAGTMPFPTAHFSSALSNSVLEHIPHIETVLQETARVLKPGGIFLFCVPNPRYFSELAVPRIVGERSAFGKAYLAWFKRISRVHHADWPDCWQDRLAQAGFRIETWWHYFSPRAMRVLEWGHYLGAPTLLPYAVAKRWIIAPTRWNLAITERLVRPFSDPSPNPQGTFTFFVTRRN